MAVKDIAPEGVRPGKVVGAGDISHAFRGAFAILLDVQAESVAAMKHDVHRLASAWDPEANCWTIIDAVGNTGLLWLEHDFEVESPKCDASLCK